MGCPKSTPWGHADLVTELLPGQVWCVSTPAHGGIYVAGDALQRIPQSFRLATFTRHPQWYEEDCDWAIVAKFVPEAFADRPGIEARADRSLRCSHRGLYESHFGATIDPA